jgi:hypothetical protein
MPLESGRGEFERVTGEQRLVALPAKRGITQARSGNAVYR